jgi:hypothetical protein
MTRPELLKAKGLRTVFNKQDSSYEDVIFNNTVVCHCLDYFQVAKFAAEF